MRRSSRLVVLLLLLAPCRPASGCTTFCLVDGGQVIFGKNYDWNIDHGLLIVNKRGVERSSSLRGPQAAARWTSRFGSVTFNQYGRDRPSGGMNEAGLVVELMWLDGAVYPVPDARMELGVLEWIQYQLDRSATVDDLIASDAQVRIAGRTPLHYLVADRSGRVAAIEFLDGRLSVHAGEELPVRALTNDRYEDALVYLRRLRDAGSSPPSGLDSLSRFARAAQRAAGYRRRDGEEAVRYAFDALGSVGGDRTQWSIVYDLGEGRVFFRTKRQQAVRSVGLRALDFSCAAPALAIDLSAPGEGDVTHRLPPYSLETNLRILRASFAGTSFLAGTTDEEVRRLARLPEASRCAAPELEGDVR